MSMAIHIVALVGWALGSPVPSMPQPTLVQAADAEMDALKSEYNRLILSDRTDEAVAVARKALALAVSRYGAESEEAIIPAMHLGMALMLKGDYGQAKAALIRAASGMERAGLASQRIFGVVQAHLGTITLRQGDADGAIQHFERALPLLERGYGVKDGTTILVVQDLGEAYLRRPGRPDLFAKAVQHYQRWQILWEQALGAGHVELGRLFLARAKAHRLRGERRLWDEWRGKALAIAEKPGDAASPARERQLLLADIFGDFVEGSAVRNAGLLQAQGQRAAILERYHGAADARTIAARKKFAELRASLAEPAPAPVRQAGPGGSQVVQASAAGGEQPIWPTGMEAGNLYFVFVRVGAGAEDPIPMMVAAASEAEALERVRQAHVRYFDDKPSLANTPIAVRLHEGGVCTGPAWGGLVYLAVDGKQIWGGGCGKTPAKAIEAAFASCRKTGNTHCETVGDGGRAHREVTLALSGNPPMSEGVCGSGLVVPCRHHLGSYNAFNLGAAGEISFNPTGAADAIAKLGTVCRSNNPCYLTTTSTRCYDTEAPDVRTAKCTDRRLTPRGLSGPLR